MSQKTVLDLIYDEFGEIIQNDNLLTEVSSELADLIRSNKPNRADIVELLKKSKNEDTETRN